MGRRDSNDLRWKKVKEVVRKRDADICRLLKVITMKEAFILKKKASLRINKLDPAHFRPVGQFPELCYEASNIVLLNRYSHEMIDSYRDPITGENITKEQVENWWIRILKGNKKQYSILVSKGIINGDI